MKKMKYFLVMLLVAMMPMVFTSCEQPQPPVDEPVKENPDDSDKDEDSYAELIVGKWHVREYSYVIYIDGDEDESDSESLSKGEWVWEFDEFGEVTAYDDYDEEEYDYQLKGEKLKTELAEDFGADYFTIKSLTEDKMVLNTHLEYEEDGDDVEIEYTITLKK